MNTRIPIVFSTQRTGSSWLFLHFHDDIHHVCYEPFNSDIPEHRAEYKQICDSVEYKVRHEKPTEYLQYLSQYGLIDLKAELVSMKVLSEITSQLDEYLAVILLRRNLLKQYISYVTANRSNVFHSEKEQQEKELIVDDAALADYTKRIFRVTDLLKSAFCEVAKIVYYEDLFDGVVSGIAEYFGIKIKNKPKTIKLHKSYSFVKNRGALNMKYPWWAI